MVALRNGEQTRTRVRIRHRRRRRRTRRGRRRLALIVLGILATFAVLATIPATAGRARLEEAREALERGRAALGEGDVQVASTSFAHAESAFLQADAQVHNPLVQAIGFLPILGRTPDVTGALVDAGRQVARAGRVIADGIGGLPEGPASLSPEDGIIPLEPISALADPIGRARTLVDAAVADLTDAPTAWLLGPVSRARLELDRELTEASEGLAAAESLARRLPAFLGGTDTRRYFLAAQNPAELRGTGGFIGAYAIMTAEDGALEFGPFRPIETLRDIDPRRIPAPNPDFAERYERFGGAGYWRNINMTADFPSAADAIERLYRRVTGEAVNGTIAVDPFALASLLRATGPIDVPLTGVSVDEQTVVPYITNQAYSQITESGVRKRILGDVALAAFERYLEGGAADPVASGRALVDAAAGGHVLLHAANPRMQAAFEAAGVAGQLGGAPGDFLAVVANNAAGNKADFYLARELRYEVRLGGEGSAMGTAEATFTNDAPTSGQPAYVIGPYDERFRPGQNVSFVTSYCATTCRLQEFRRDGRPEAVGEEEELGHPAYWNNLELDSGASQGWRYDWSVAEAWEGDDAHGLYRLTVQGQTTIRPTKLIVDIRTPEGTTVISASPRMRVSGNRAVWEGAAGDRATFEVAFERPFVSRVWRAIVRFWDRPIFRFGD